MAELNICIDIDGTVTEANYWLAGANRFFGKDVDAQSVTDYEIHKVMGIRQDDYTAFYEALGEDIHWQSEIRQGAKRAIEQLSMRNNIHFVTARQQDMHDVSADWLKTQGIRYDTLTLLGTSHKAGSAEALQCDWFVEDSLSNATELSDAGFRVLLVDCSYNQGALPPGIRRVDNWYQIEAIIHGKTMEKVSA